MSESQTRLYQLAFFEALRNQHQNLQETIGRLVDIMKMLPEGEIRSRLVDEISCLDVIADVMRGGAGCHSLKS